MNERSYPCRRALPMLVSAALGAAALQAAAEPKLAVQERWEIFDSIAAPNAQRARRQLDAAFDKGGIDWPTVEAVLAEPGLGDAAREFLLHDVLIRIRAAEPDAEARRFVGSLLAYDSKTYVLHDEGPLPIAVYPLADLAQGTLGAWHRREVERQTSAALAAGDMRGLQSLRSPGTDEYRAALAALRNADTLASVRAQEWLTAHTDGTDYYEARALLALRQQDAARTSELLKSGRGPEAVRLLKAVRMHFDSTTTFELLEDATDNPVLASAAIYEIDALRAAGLASRVDDYLVDALGDKTLGATAAAVVARRGDHRLFERVADTLLAPTATRDQQARAVLALTLADNPYAKRALENAANKGRIADRGLQQEVSRWLQR